MSLNKIWNTDIWASNVWNWDIWADAVTAKMALLATITFGPILNGTVSSGHRVSGDDPEVNPTLNASIDIEPEE
jgi:hypothetical protein